MEVKTNMYVTTVLNKNLSEVLSEKLKKIGWRENQTIEFIESNDMLIIKKKRERNITDLKGLGKEIWKKVNVEEYVNQERNSWR